MKTIYAIILISMLFCNCSNSEKVFTERSKRQIPDSLREYAILENKPPTYNAIDFKSLSYPLSQNFNFVYVNSQWGRTILNTFEKYFVSDLVSNRQAKISMEFSTAQMDSLYQFLNNHDFLNTYKDLQHTSLHFVGDRSVRYLYIHYNKTTIVTTFGDSFEKKDYMVTFVKILHKMLRNHKQYQKLPEPEGAYF